MVKKRTSGGGLGVILAQHFDTGIDLVRRLTGELVARFDKIGTDSDPQIVTGTIGRRMGSFLMQLVASPSTRPAYGHLWGLGGVAAIHNGDGTATPILDAWANKDTDIAALTVDVGTQTVSAGDVGVIMRGSNDDAQSLVFLKGGSGGGGGSGAAGMFGDGSDGAITLDNTQHTSDTGNNPFQFNGAVGRGAHGNGPPPFDSHTFYTLNRDIYCTTFDMTSDVVLCTNGYRIFATASITIGSTCVLHNSVNGGFAANNYPSGGFPTFMDISLSGGGVVLGFSTGATASGLSSIGGNGGDGGSTPGSGGTNAGNPDKGNFVGLAEQVGGMRYAPNLLSVRWETMLAGGSPPHTFPYVYSTGGCQGGTASTAFGGYGVGGFGGAIVVLSSPTITNNGTIHANGQDGTQGFPSGGLGPWDGGGSGGGGAVVTYCTTYTGSTPTANAGTPGAGHSGGANGSAGVAGTVLQVVA